MKSPVQILPTSPSTIGWRRRAIWAVLGLRPPFAQHTEAEANLIRRYATGASRIVEIGVAEGGSAKLLADVMRPGGRLSLVDPYPPGHLVGINMMRIVARRLVTPRNGTRVQWVREYSFEAASHWHDGIEFLFIDANHEYAPALKDWSDWNRFVVPGGLVALHDARLFEGGWTSPQDGPVRVAALIQQSSDWALIDYADSTVVFRRKVPERALSHN